MDVGRVCVKLAVREVGRKCVLLERIDKKGTGEEAVKAAPRKAKVSFGD